MEGQHEQFMKLAIEQAIKGMDAGEQPFGSVIVRDGEVIGSAHNVQNSRFDATAHAETLVIRNTTINQKVHTLTGCTLYTTCEPCMMCAGATMMSGISTLVMGARAANLRNFEDEVFSSGEDEGGPFDFHEYTIERVVELTAYNLEVVTGVLEEECENIYRNTKIKLTR